MDSSCLAQSELLLNGQLEVRILQTVSFGQDQTRSPLIRRKNCSNFINFILHFDIREYRFYPEGALKWSNLSVITFKLISLLLAKDFTLKFSLTVFTCFGKSCAKALCAFRKIGTVCNPSQFMLHHSFSVEIIALTPSNGLSQSTISFIIV